MVRKYKSDFLVLALLALLNAVYCHRFYGVFFPLEGDALYHIYFRLNESLMWADHNPYQWYYSNLMSFVGLWNPVLWLVRGFFALFFARVPELSQAIYINMLTAGLCHFLLSTSVYLFFRWTGLRLFSSLVGSVIVSFTGLHLAGIREFDYVFAYSFAFVGPVIICFTKLHERDGIFWAALGSLAIGASLLSGGNVPLFFYLPVCFALPLWKWIKEKDFIWAIRSFLLMLLSIVAGVLLAAVATFPTAYSLSYSNRIEIAFNNIAAPLSPLLKLATLFLRDWFRVGIVHYHERDYFLGLPVVALLVLGFGWLYQQRKKLTSVDILLTACLIWGLVITQFTWLPHFIQEPIAYFYDRLSIRNANRFFLLMLLPIGYFAARAIENLSGRKVPIVLGGAFLTLLALAGTFLVPHWTALLPDMRLAAIDGLTLSFLAAASLWFLWLFQTRPTVRQGLQVSFIFFLFGMYLLSPQQLTNYLVHFLVQPSRLMTVDSDRLLLKNRLGLGWNYSRIEDRARPYFLQAPPEIAGASAEGAKILDLTVPDPFAGNLPNFFAPKTRHQFAFTLVDDHLSSWWMQQIYRLDNSAVLDMSNVCWTRREAGRALDIRQGCLPPAFFVPNAFKFRGEDEVLDWMKTASRSDFSNGVALDCSRVNCRSLHAGSTLLSDLDENVAVKTLEPGKMDLSAAVRSDGFILISQHYRGDWSATVNGTTQPVIRANHAFMAIPVRAGQNQIQLRLNLTVRKVGIAVSLMMLFFLVGVALKFQRLTFRESTGPQILEGGSLNGLQAPEVL